jgi:hypothetical protein
MVATTMARKARYEGRCLHELRELDLERTAPLRTALLVATFRCAALARCGAFVDERRIVAGDEGGRVRTWRVHIAALR